jgi:hypothetical protein
MGGSAMVMQDGEVAPFENGLPQIRAFIVPSDRVFFKGNWDVMGLRGTGSFDFEVPEQHVDVGMTFSLFETRPITGGALYGLGPVVVRALHEIAEIGKAGRVRLGSLSLREQQTFQRDFGLHSVAVKAARLLAKESYGSGRSPTAAPSRPSRGAKRPRSARRRSARRKQRRATSPR